MTTTELGKILAELDKVAESYRGSSIGAKTDREVAKEYCKNHPPVTGKPAFCNRTRTVGGEFSSPQFLQPKQFQSEWDRERCQAPQRTYPSRKGAVSMFYNPLGRKKDWKPGRTCSREFSVIIHIE